MASAFDWPGWDRSGKSEEDALRVLAAYRPRYATVAALAGLAKEFGATGELTVVERVQGIGMTDYYGVSARSAEPEQEQMTEAARERKIASGAVPGTCLTTPGRWRTAICPESPDGIR